MKKLAILTTLVLASASLHSQTLENGTLNARDKGLFALSFNDGQQQFRMGGYLQLNALYDHTEDQQDRQSMGLGRAYFNLEGVLAKEKLSFLLQMDFAQNSPLLDAWLAYHPWEFLKISVGQKQTFTNGREMSLLDQSLRFGKRSLASRSFCNTGREFGLFVESRLPVGMMGLDLGAAVTSGDGRNSFGSSSLDVDKGGLKYGAAATLYPLGFFTPGNEVLGVDLARENCPKLALGIAYSYNVGASDPVGEGHGTFIMYDKNGEENYPDYRKMSADLTFKFKGFSLLAQWINGNATSLVGIYTEAVSSSALKPRQIADYLALGNGYALQAGYLTRNGWSVDAGASMVEPEWEETATSVLRKEYSGTFAVGKYFKGNTLRVQALCSYSKYAEQPNNENLVIGAAAHVMF